MNIYELTQREQAGTRIVGSVQATTQAQAARKLYRAHNVQAAQAAGLGYKVRFQTPAPKEPNHG